MSELELRLVRSWGLVCSLILMIVVRIPTRGILGGFRVVHHTTHRTLVWRANATLTTCVAVAMRLPSSGILPTVCTTNST